MSSITPSERVRSRLEELFVLGEEPHANRPGLSAAESRAFELAAGWMSEAGLDVATDAVGNLTGRRAGRGRQVWLGSHLDTVPAGGRFDGALGVVAAIEAAAALPDANVAVWAFRDEEGHRFGRSCFGSRALCGALEPGELDVADAAGVTVRQALRELGHADPPLGGWLSAPPAAYLELHIEQGPVLAGRDVPLGIVTAITGLAEAAVRFRGSRGHAGTTPMAGRADALRAAGLFVHRVGQLAESLDGAVATVGRLEVKPGAQNVIPDDVALGIDLRAPEERTLTALHDDAQDLAVAAADEHRCTVEWRHGLTTAPAGMDPALRDVLREAADAAGVPAAELHSGAGHDAAILAAAGVPTAMLFVRSLAGGVSHSPDEDTSTADIGAAIAVLTAAVGALR